jgi:hypothetical protein
MPVIHHDEVIARALVFYKADHNSGNIRRLSMVIRCRRIGLGRRFCLAGCRWKFILLRTYEQQEYKAAQYDHQGYPRPFPAPDIGIYMPGGAMVGPVVFTLLHFPDITSFRLTKFNSCLACKDGYSCVIKTMPKLMYRNRFAVLAVLSNGIFFEPRTTVNRFEK